MGDATTLELKAVIEDGMLVMRIGIGTLAHAFEHSPCNYDDTLGGPAFKVTDKSMFAEDVLMQILHEDETGNSALTRMIDDACDRVVDTGSLSVAAGTPATPQQGDELSLREVLRKALDAVDQPPQT